MKRALTFVALLAVIGMASAQQISTPADAFNAGKDFANSGKSSAGNAVNTATGSANLPNYSTTAPETANFQNGRSPIGGAGQSKQTQCQTYKAANGFEQQECDAVNFLGKNSTTRPKFNIDKATDSIMVGSKIVVGNPGSIPGASSQQCRVEKVKNPATYITETCTESMTTEVLSCDEAFVGCTVTGRKLECRPVSATCIAGGGSCCMVNISCTGSAAIIQHSDCCGYRYSKTISNVNDFTSGVTYNPAGARITCNSSGSCSMSFENYYCNNPSRSIGSYPNTNAFNLNTTPVFSCIEGGGCEALEARTK